jgi:hypothetical protein
LLLSPIGAVVLFQYMSGHCQTHHFRCLLPQWDVLCHIGSGAAQN